MQKTEMYFYANINYLKVGRNTSMTMKAKTDFTECFFFSDKNIIIIHLILLL